MHNSSLAELHVGEELDVMERNEKYGLACSLSKKMGPLLCVLAACLCG